MKGEFVASAVSPESFPSDRLPEVALLGRSNVGKSSLINRLVGQKDLAYTSSRPGCTQTINFFRIDHRLYLVDLPGYGYAHVSQQQRASWKQLIESYLIDRPHLRLALLLVDARRGWMEKDLDLKLWLETRQIPYLVVLTKTDKLKPSDLGRVTQSVRQNGSESVPFSALTGRGVRELWQAITTLLHP